MKSNSVCNNFHVKEVNGNAATFIYELLQVLQNVKTLSFSLASLLELLLLLSGDTEVCHGPRPKKIPEVDTLMKTKGLHVFNQNVRGLLSKKDYWVEFFLFFYELN